MNNLRNGCGTELEEGASFCTQCGAKVTDAVNDLKEPSVKESQLEEQESKPEVFDEKNTPAPLGAFFGLIVLFSIPVIGWIACIIMAFAPKNQSIKNYARAKLIWVGIGIVFTVAFCVFASWIGGLVLESLNERFGGDFNFSSFSEIIETFTEFKEGDFDFPEEFGDNMPGEFGGMPGEFGGMKDDFGSMTGEISGNESGLNDRFPEEIERMPEGAESLPSN